MLHPESLPWQSVGPGYSVKLLHGGGGDATRALLLRLEPGVVVPRHRHEGEVHALNLAGTGKLLDTGELVGLGGYVDEPTGNVDTSMAVGEETVIVFVTVRGAMEDLDDAGQALSRSTTPSMTESYERFVESGAR
jgi:quercetin dioxygenase-like cupin family protein